MPKRKQRSYSNDDRAMALAALDANSGNLARTARETGVPRMTLREWARGRVGAGVTTARQEKRSSLADELEAIAWRLIESAPAKINSANLSQTMTALGIAIDKMRLLRSQATVIAAD